ncbi:phosphatase PAP2 family protein [Cellulomonas soli]
MHPSPAAPTRAAPSAVVRAHPLIVGSAALIAVVAAVGVWLLWRVFVDTWAGQRVDQAALEGARYGQVRLWQVAERVLDVVSVGFVAAVLVAAVVIALVRRRWSLAVQVAVLMIGANVTTRVLKLMVFERPDLGVKGVWGNTLPSGHTTAAASVAVALLLVVPPRVRPWAAGIGAAYTTATGVSTLVGQWHRPSDVVAAVLVVLAWSAAVCALVALDPRPAATSTGMLPAVGPSGRPRLPVAVRRTATTLLVGGLLATPVGAVALSVTWQRRESLVTRGELLTAYAGGVCAVLASACLGFALLLLLRHAAGTAAARV